ncbi:MAG: universal stress protein [Chloroflexota bacterium]
MRILLATDGSAAADQALDLVAGLPWPGGSAIDIVHVIQLPIVPLGSLGQVIGPAEAADVTSAMEPRGHRVLEVAQARVAGPGRHVHTHLMAGRPARSSRTSPSTGTDLVVTGHRGHSGLVQMLLGSVAGEVVDASPVPVLVARTTVIGEVLLAVDGTPAAKAAVDLVERLPVLHDRRIQCSRSPTPAYPLVGGHGLDGGGCHGCMGGPIDASRASHARVTQTTVERLRAAGIDARAVTGEGRPADVIGRGERDPDGPRGRRLARSDRAAADGLESRRSRRAASRGLLGARRSRARRPRLSRSAAARLRGALGPPTG